MAEKKNSQQKKKKNKNLVGYTPKMNILNMVFSALWTQWPKILLREILTFFDYLHPWKLTWLAGKSPIYEDVFPIESGDFQL